MNAGLNALLSKLKLIDQRKDATAPTYNEFDFSAAFDTLPVPANTSGSSILESSTPLLAIYFGAQWCPPCRAFSPKLSQFAKDNASQISVILCSADHSHVQAQQFARGKSFLVIPWTSTARSELQSYFKITSFPTLIVLDTRKQSCQVITRWGRLAISTEKAKGQLVQRWLSNQGGLFPHHYYYYIGVALVFVIVLMFYKF